jgi:hypothetical protein
MPCEVRLIHVGLLVSIHAAAGILDSLMAYRGIIFEECKILGDCQILDGLGAALLEDVEITRSQIFDCGLLWVQRLC